MVTKTEIEEYVKGLEEATLRSVYVALSGLYIDDTLSDDFQIWAELMDVFKKYAERQKGG